MGYESTAEPIKIGYLMDFLLPEGFPQTYFEDLTQPFDLVFKKASSKGGWVPATWWRADSMPTGSTRTSSIGSARSSGQPRASGSTTSPTRLRYGQAMSGGSPPHSGDR